MSHSILRHSWGPWQSWERNKGKADPAIVPLKCTGTTARTKWSNGQEDIIPVANGMCINVSKYCSGKVRTAELCLHQRFRLTEAMVTNVLS